VRSLMRLRVKPKRHDGADQGERLRELM